MSIFCSKNNIRACKKLLFSAFSSTLNFLHIRLYHKTTINNYNGESMIFSTICLIMLSDKNKHILSLYPIILKTLYYFFSMVCI